MDVPANEEATTAAVPEAARNVVRKVREKGTREKEKRKAKHTHTHTECACGGADNGLRVRVNPDASASVLPGVCTSGVFLLALFFFFLLFDCEPSNTPNDL